MLEAKNISKTYKNAEKPAVSQASFTLRNGEILAVIGESGSGKTTLLKILAGLLDRDEGEVVLDGKIIPGPAHQLVPGIDHIRLVHQDFDLQANYNLRENLRHPLLYYDEQYQQERIDILIRICELEELVNLKPTQLSGGQQQRLAIARAMATEPKVLLMDEPFSHLDAIHRLRLKSSISAVLKEAGASAIFVTHDTRDALAMADTIAVMQAGKIVQFGTPYEIYEKPLDAYVAELFGQVNIFPLHLLKTVKPQKVKKYGGQAQVCIRPENLKLTTKKQKGIPVRIASVYYQGGYWLTEAINFEGNISFSMHLKKRPPIVGAQAYLRVPNKKMHVFTDSY